MRWPPVHPPSPLPRTLFSNKAQPARDAAWEIRHLPQWREKESQHKQGHGGNLPVGLSVCTSIKVLPHLGHRGAAGGSFTVPPVPLVVVATTLPLSNWLACLSRCRFEGLRKPSERTVMKRSGSTGWRNRRMHSSAGTVEVLTCAVADALD